MKYQTQNTDHEHIQEQARSSSQKSHENHETLELIQTPVFLGAGWLGFIMAHDAQQTNQSPGDWSNTVSHPMKSEQVS